MCSSKDKGPVVKKACQVGCIGCRACAKLAEDESITMDGFLAIVDYGKTLTNMKVVEKCPTNCIVFTGEETESATEATEPKNVSQPASPEAPASAPATQVSQEDQNQGKDENG